MYSHRYRVTTLSRLFVLAVVMGIALLPVRAEKQPAYSLHADVQEVRLTFVATDASAGETKAITPADIAVVDDGEIIRHFRSLRRVSEDNLNVIVLVDASESVAEQFQRQITETERLITDSRWRPADRISVLFFGGTKADFACLRDCRSLAPETWASKIHAQGQTPLYDALVVASDFAAENTDPTYRSIAILISDGKDTISRNSASDAASGALRAGLPIYTVDTGNATVVPENGMLARIASLTGGRSFARGNVSAMLTSLLEERRCTYVLTYEPPSRTEGVHSVRILPTSNLNLNFRCRRAYYYARADAGTEGANP